MQLELSGQSRALEVAEAAVESAGVESAAVIISGAFGLRLFGWRLFGFGGIRLGRLRFAAAAEHPGDRVAEQEATGHAERRLRRSGEEPSAAG